jgi:glycosyltransferase involved in cell wall biosynthesis
MTPPLPTTTGSAAVAARPLAILHTEASTGWGGQELRILTEMEGFARRGHRVHLLTPENAGIFAAARERGLPVDALPIEWKRWPGFAALRGWLARNGRAFDVVNTHSSTDSWLVAYARLTLSGMPPVVRTRHVSTRVNRSPTTRWMYQRATAHIVVTGEALKEQLVRDNGFDPARITSVRTGIDLARFRPGDRAAMRARCGVDDRPAVGIVATLRDWKGHDPLLEAWALLRARVPGWQLLVIGDGPRRAHLEARVDAMGLRGDVRFVGNRDDVPEWLACLDLVALPSYGEEGVPQSLMQAAACGLPAVSTTVGAIREAVIDGETGLIVPPNDVPALAGALHRLMADAALRAQMGAAARVRAEREFGSDRMVDAMERVFAGVAAASPRAGGSR